MDVFNQTLRVFSNRSPVASREYWGDSTDDLLIDDFVHSIIEDRPVSITAEDGIAAMRVALAAYESARKKDVVILRG
jgi:predicted dehydrogenase